ncbi:RpiR family transcriptional regulator [Enterobacter hormaechei]|nr:RpiR family transcriptional regulator [Enterobacter hormaechei]VAG57237.1 RpiR family transcriptional regulator [Enterobacter hormaechei]
MPALFTRFVANYQQTFQWVTQDKRQQFASLLRQKESFFLYGAGFSYLFAEYLTKKLQVLGKTAFISGPGDSRNIFLSNAARYQVFIAVSRSGETEQVLDKARIAKNVGMTIVAFTRASANTLGGMADVHFALYDEAVHFAAEAAGVTSFESNLVLLMDLLLLEATG